MNALIPNRFLFSFEFQLRYRRDMPKLDGKLTSWTDAELLPRLSELDGKSDFADVWACWNETGIAIACRVTGRHKPLRCDPKKFWTGDNLRICTDMRDARTVKRATRFCQQFYFLPTGGGPGRKRPVAGVNPIKRAREDAPPIPVERIEVASRVTKSGYSLEAFIPGKCLNGFDLLEHSRIGFYYILEDTERGQQYLTVGDDLYWYVDPSTWATAVLDRMSNPE
ncbi:MAG: hypothetical protein JSU63_20335 [Phycisphaerales bacterium]|nr:MAG: hypothetical protein JSU63_20335 [Phycisphaerales bacterium]